MCTRPPPQPTSREEGGPGSKQAGAALEHALIGGPIRPREQTLAVALRAPPLALVPGEAEPRLDPARKKVFLGCPSPLPKVNSVFLWLPEFHKKQGDVPTQKGRRAWRIERPDCTWVALFRSWYPFLGLVLKEKANGEPPLVGGAPQKTDPNEGNQ